MLKLGEFVVVLLLDVGDVVVGCLELVVDFVVLLVQVLYVLI